MRTDIEIARSVQKAPITNIAAQIGITDDCLHNYGKFIAKVPVNLIDEQRVKQSNLILVTAITPTKAGIGKTTVSVGLALGLNKIGKQAVPALREPSLGPCFGMKGGGQQVVATHKWCRWRTSICILRAIFMLSHQHTTHLRLCWITICIRIGERKKD